MNARTSAISLAEVKKKKKKMNIEKVIPPFKTRDRRQFNNSKILNRLDKVNENQVLNDRGYRSRKDRPTSLTLNNMKFVLFADDAHIFFAAEN